MKKIFTILSMALAILASCSKEIENVPAGGKVEKTFSATLCETKATLEGVKVTWQETDEIAVYDGYDVNKFTVRSCDGSTAEFVGMVDADASSFQAVYPYSAASQAFPVAGRISFTLPSEQTVDANGISPEALVCIAEATDGGFAFKNVVSLVKLQIADSDVKAVEIEGFDDELIAGVSSAEVGGDVEAGSVKTVTIKPASETFVPGDYYFSILPATFAKGFKLSLVLEDGKNLIQTTKSAEFIQGNIRTLNTTGAVKIPFVIRNAEDMRNFAKNAAVYTASDVVKVAADFDMSDAAWTPVAFKCTLDGQGHKISGIKIAAGGRVGFIGNMPAGAVLKNIVLGSADGSTYDGVSNVTYTGTAAGYQGGVVSDLQGTIENVKSFIAVNHSTNDSGNRIGGLVGCIESSGKMIDCEFAGTLTLDNNTGTNTHMAGGLVGRMHNNIVDAQTVKGCKFSGVINNSDQKMEAVGGIVGIMQGGSIVDAVSAGTINMDYNNYFAYAGGVVGFYQSYATYTSVVSGCVNSTTIAGVQRLLAESGIVAYVQRGASGPLTIDGCTNNADITVQTKPTALTCLGGIIGLTQEVNGDVYKKKLTLTNNINNGRIDVTPAGTDVEIRLGGIAGYLCGTVAFEISGNANNGEVTALGRSISAGGIVARLCAPGTVVSGNTNNAAVTFTSNNQWSLAGGIVGYSNKNLTMTDNVNKGNVIISSTVASDNYAGGIIGQFVGSGDTNNRCVLNITGGKSTGAINSPGRAGVIFSALGGGTYVNCNLNGVGIGGSKNGTKVTAENYGAHLWSYNNNTYHSITGAGTCFYVAE